MKESKKCPNCGFEGLMECWTAVGESGKNCKCPNCKFTFGNHKK